MRNVCALQDISEIPQQNACHVEVFAPAAQIQIPVLHVIRASLSSMEPVNAMKGNILIQYRLNVFPAAQTAITA